MSAPPSQSLPERILETLSDILLGVLNQTRDVIAAHGLNFLLGLLTLLLGWFLAALLRGLAGKSARALGIDVIADRSGFRRFLEKNDLHHPPSRLFGWLVYALVFYAGTMAAFDRMGLEMAADLLHRFARIVPRAMVVLLLLALGVLLGRIARSLTTRAARIGRLPLPECLGEVVRLAVGLFALFLALNYLDWASPAVLTGGFALMLGLLLGISLFFALAAKGLTESLLNHPFLKATYQKGDWIRCPVGEGTVVKIDAAAVHLKTNQTLTIIPNRILAAQTVELRRADSPKKSKTGR